MRSYEQYCGLAKALDVVGDRWTLLIIRELELRGPSRYTDIRNGLPGIATNLLADRLRELERAGVLTREEAPPPIATTLFELTPRGRQLRPALEELTLWGLPLMAEQAPEDAVRSHWLASLLEVMLTDRQPDASRLTLELHIGDEPIVIEAGDGTIRSRIGTAEDPAVTMIGQARPIMGFLLGRIELAEATAAGVEIRGDPATLDRIRGDATVTAAP
jgi:DNA-binding HxlR family transcriptional regulator